MIDASHEKKRLLVKVSSMYYMDGLNQQEISERLGISRPQISRMLAAAKSEGIVQISIRNPFSEEQAYERAIAETFGIHDVIVVHVPDADRQVIDLHVARAASALLESAIKDRDVVGIMAGRTIASIAREMHYVGRKEVQFVPMIGGFGSDGGAWHANTNARVFAEQFKARHLLLNAPAVVASPEARNLFINESEISKVLESAKRVSLALIGIGQVTKQATIVKSGYFSDEEMAEVRGNGAVCNVSTSFLNESGERVRYDGESRMIGLTIDEIRSIPNVIAVATGDDKVEAIVSALRGKCMDVLVTDMETAKQLLEWQRKNPAR
ncbi:sugar-binding transcriptional regulator [Cohnella cholangitidis]|uniref:Sugar-binding transcriptional regulator n=1 Tax=Cohnella cholangitidis TaxID=2598458 RepID=A0A7G5BWM2_9BACL|nr:sugar-binding transcriptional regulator [Cohnella cholangitidis]QMV41356.1 sugar-binding transcriptional regulator [Cohnella cholangitidis]